MALNTAGLNLAAAGAAAGITHIGLATADPGANGTSNPSTAGRLPANWAAPVDGNIVLSGKNFTGGEPSGPVTHVTFWSAATNGTCYGSAAIPADGSSDRAFNAAGELTVTSATVDF